MKFPINEIFGPTIQGEGMHAGIVTEFIRFAGCDCKCAWCDTKKAWDTENAHEMTTDDILSLLRHPAAPVVTLTGGNPLLYELGNLVERLLLKYYEVHLETQATIYQDWYPLVTFASLSPKKEFLNLKVLDQMVNDRCQLKIVVFDRSDLMFAEEIHARYKHIPMTIQIGYPEPGDSGAWITQAVASNKNFNRRVRVLPQVHRVFWGNAESV